MPLAAISVLDGPSTNAEDSQLANLPQRPVDEPVPYQTELAKALIDLRQLRLGSRLLHDYSRGAPCGHYSRPAGSTKDCLARLF
jgi:hypothetical protein